jgi:hypothetical protein
METYIPYLSSFVQCTLLLQALQARMMPIGREAFCTLPLRQQGIKTCKLLYTEAWDA